jgi:hypothetical protein
MQGLKSAPQLLHMLYLCGWTSSLLDNAPVQESSISNFDILKYPYEILILLLLLLNRNPIIGSAVCSGAPLHTTAAEQKKVATLARYQGAAKMA